MAKELIGQDECYKYMIKKLKVRFVRRLGYDCEEVIFINTELMPSGNNHKFMDVACYVMGNVSEILNCNPIQYMNQKWKTCTI